MSDLFRDVCVCVCVYFVCVYVYCCNPETVFFREVRKNVAKEGHNKCVGKKRLVGAEIGVAAFV